MNEEYLKGLYEHFGGQAKLGGTFEEWSSGISSNDDYKKGMFETLGGADKMGGSYDEWNTNIFGVKKKVGEEVSESSEEPTTTGDFEQWELDLFKQFDENPKSLSTASSVDLRKYNDYKESIGEEAPTNEVAQREDYQLSFKEEERKPVNYFSLFDKKDLVDQANKQGVSVSFAEEASQAAANSEYPIAFLAKRKNIRDRIKKLPEYAPNATNEIQALSNVDIDSRNIDDVEFQLSQIENRHLDPMGTVVSTEGRPMEINPTRSAYEREVKENPAGVAIEQLQRDNDRLRKAASLPKSTERADLEEEVAKDYTEDELAMFEEFDKNPDRLRGASEEMATKYSDFKSEIASGMTVQDVINARRNIFRGTGSGIAQYVTDYTNLIDQLVGNKAVTDLQNKLDRIENGDNIELTTDDKLLMRAIMDNAKLHNELDEEIPTSYKIGESLGQSIGFMGEFVLTGGGLQAAGRGVLKGAAKTGAKKAVGKFGVGTAVKLAQAGIQTAKMPAFYKNTALNVSNGQNFGEAALNAYWETGVESLSERIFMSSPVSGVVGDGATGLLRRAGINFNVDKGAVGVFKNVLEEAAEEKIGEIMTAPKDYETFSEFWKAFTDREQNTIMLGSVALMTGGMGSVALTGNKFSETQRKARVKRIEKYIPSDLRAEIDVITSNVDLSLDQQYSLIGDAISSRIETQELGEDPATTTANAMQYAQYRVQEQAANTTDENAVVENGEITVGEVEPVGTMQDQLDYLNEKGVDTNGLNAEQVEKLYDKTKSKEDKEAIDEAIKQPSAEELKARAEQIRADNAELDTQISEAQTRLGLSTTPDIDVSDDTEVTLDRIDNNEPVTNDFIKNASDELYKIYNDLEAMKQSDSRVYTTEQIESMQEFLGEEITKLEDYAAKQKETGKFVGETEVSETTETGDREVIETEKIETKPRVTNLKEETKDAKQEVREGEQAPQREDEKVEDEQPSREAEPTSEEEYQASEAPSEEVLAEFKPFADIVRESETIDEAFQKVSKIKNVPAETSQMFREKYDPEQNLTPKQAFEKFYNVIKATGQPQAPTEAKTEQKGTIAPSGEKVAEKAPKQPSEQKIKEASKQIADTLRKAKFTQSINDLSQLKSDPTAPLQVAWDGAIELAAKTIEAGGTVAQAVADGVSYLKESDWYKSLSDNSKKIAEQRASEDITKTLEDAEKIRTQAQEAVQEERISEEEVQRVRVRDTEKNRVEAEKEKVGDKYKSSRLGVRYAFGEGFTEAAKEAYRKNQLHKYKPESQEEVVAVAEVVFNTNDDAAIERIVRGKETPRRVRQVLGVMLGNKYSQDAENALREGNTELGDQMIDAEQQIMKEVQRMATESGRDVAIFNSEFMTDMLTPYKTARMVERAMSNHAGKVRKSHGYKKTKEIVQDELEKLRPSVMKAVGKDKRVQQAKKKAKRQTDPRKEKIRKEISDLTDMLRATKGSSASVSIIGLSNEQIEIGGKIAVKYIELGIVNVQELIQRLKKEFNKAGIEITDDEARQMIPERDGKTVEELEKEQALEAAAEKLAQEEFGYVADRRAPKTDPIAQMVRTLTSKFRERAKEGERPAPRSNMDIIKEAILNKTDYMEVWNEARQSAMDLIDKMVADEKVTEAQAEVYKQRVEDSYKRATTFSVSESRIQQLIRESFKEREISIDDVVRDHYERRELHKQELIDDLVAKSGLTNEAAKELADVIDNAFQTLMVKKGEALIRKYLKKKDVKPKKQGAKSPIAELIELINIGALNNPEFDAIFDEMYGVPQLTDRQRNEIIRRGKKIQKIKAADVRHKAEQDLMAYVMDLEGVNGAEVLTAFWYAHVLSGVPTHIRNISDAYVSSYLETLNLAGFDVRAIRGMIKAHRRGMKYEGRQRLIETMTTGFTPLAKKLEIPSALERITFEPKGDKRDAKLLAKTAEIYRKIFRYVPRFLSATDAYIYAGAKEASAYIVKFRREVALLEDEKGRKLNRSERKALHKHMNELLYVDKATVERIRAEVEQESEDYKQIQRDFGEEPTGYNQREKYLREFELIDQQRGLDVTDTAFDIAGRAIGNIKSHGMLGAVVDGVSRFLRRINFTIGKPSVTMRKGKPIITFDQTKQVTIRPLALVIPFTRIVANVATRNLGWNMYWGAVRASTGAYGKFLGKDSQYYMEMSLEEKKVAWQKVLKIGIIHSMLFMLTQPDDDGDSLITITFDGTGNYEKNKQLEESGWKPYSIQIGDVSFSYLTLGGLAMLFAPIGYMRDKQKYTDTDNSDLELYAKGNLFAIGHVIKSTPVYAINKVFEMINKMMTGDEEQFFKKLSQTAGSMATGFVSPKAVSDIINLMGVVSQNPREKPETALARALQYVPLVDLDEGRIHYDVFGEAVPKNMSLSQIIEKVKRDDNVQYYIEQGYFRPSLSIHQTKFEIADDRDNRVRRPLNPNRKQEVELFNKYESTVGRRFKEEVMRLREDGIEGEEFVNEMESRWREIIKDAKADVYSETRDRPLKYDKDAEIKE